MRQQWLIFGGGTVAEEAQACFWIFVFQISISDFKVKISQITAKDFVVLLASTGAYHPRPLSRPLFRPRARRFPTSLVIVGKQ
jgi:hypothetical protein